MRALQGSLDLFTLSGSRRFFIFLYFLCCEACWSVKVVSQGYHGFEEGTDTCRVTHTSTHTPVYVGVGGTGRMNFCMEEGLPEIRGRSAHCVCVCVGVGGVIA